MHLERLEISGFKSFSDRSELAFDRGVTAIVGPNGCGKSNVADALTWVLGEQSAKSLRGDKMEDVIFSGSDARKPTGAAEVRLRFGNVIVPPSLLKELGEEPPEPRQAPNGEPGTAVTGNGNGHHAETAVLIDSVTREVEVTRRLFRSGESEYLIDGQTCRLRDIHELLMDTGLGAKAYAIIEQGKIGMILSSRPTDRRQLIEEAAGITKYKARRRAAELKLEAAQQNLTRLEDIIYEIDKQRGSLKRQAAKARRYTRLRDEMRRWEKVLFARRYRSLSEAIDAARARLNEARTNEAAASARLAEVENELGRIRIELASADAAATAAREAVHAHELEINRRQQQIALDTQQAEMLKKRAEELEQERVQLEARREPERLALEGRRLAAAQAATARDEAAGLAAAAAEEYTRAWMAIEALEQDVEKARSDLYAVLNTITALTAAHDAAAAQRERAVEANSRLDLEARELGAELERARAQRTAAAEALHRAQDGLESARMARAARESELASARVEHEWRSREVRTREQELAGMAARLHSLEEIDTHRGGFADAARMVLVNANGKVGQMGAVADFIDVEPRYERAVEACLGDLLQHILVERLEHVSAGLKLIRQEDAGRCGFVVGRPDGRRAVLAAVSPRWSPRRRFIVGGSYGLCAAIVRGAREWAVPQRDSGGHGRRANRRFVRGRIAHRADDCVSGGDARRRRLLRQARGHRRREGRIARHPRHQARDQGTAREDHRGQGLAGSPGHRGGRLRAGDGARDGGNRRASPTKFTGRKNPSSACRARPSAPTMTRRACNSESTSSARKSVASRKRSPGSMPGRRKRANQSRD